MTPFLFFFQAGQRCLQPIDENKQTQPDYVHEVPVPGDGLECKMIVRFEVATQATQPDNQEHSGTQSDMKTVEASEHEEGGALNAGVHGQVQFRVGVYVLPGLQTDEQRAQGNGQKQAEDQGTALVLLQTPVRPGNRTLLPRAALPPHPEAVST